MLTYPDRFLWVAFLLGDVCAQHYDDDIRDVLRSLPRNLEETFNRALNWILRRGHEMIAQNIFRWVAAAKRPSSLEELREAIAIEHGQPHSKPERLANGMNRISAWRENLIQIDEETDLLQFAHHTIKKFVLSESSERQLNGFHFELSDADNEVGEICVTYLNFNDFKTQLIRKLKSQPSINPMSIARTALEHQPNLKAATSLAGSVIARLPERRTGSI